jgi:hypothetical protein
MSFGIEAQPVPTIVPTEEGEMELLFLRLPEHSAAGHD